MNTLTPVPEHTAAPQQLRQQPTLIAAASARGATKVYGSDSIRERSE